MPSDQRSPCIWKGEAADCEPEVDGGKNAIAIGHSPMPKAVADQIQGRVLFSRGVGVAI